MPDAGFVSECIVMDPHTVSRPWIIYGLHELIVRCLFTVQLKWVRRLSPGRPLTDISAFRTFLQASSRHRLSLSQISQALTAAVRWLHYAPICLMFAVTRLLTPTSFFAHPPQSIAVIRQTETMTNELWEGDDMDVSRCPPTPPLPSNTSPDVTLRCRMDAQHYFGSECSTWVPSERSCMFLCHRRAMIASCCIHIKTACKGLRNTLRCHTANLMHWKWVNECWVNTWSAFKLCIECVYVCMYVCAYIYIYILVNRWKYLIVINHMIFMS